MQVTELLDLMKDVTGSDYATAQRLGVSRQEVSNWRNGRPCPIDIIAIMADFCGLDAIEAIKETIAAKLSPKRAEMLRDAIKRATRTAATVAIIGAAALSGAPETAHAAHMKALDYVCYVNRRRSWLSRYISLMFGSSTPQAVGAM